MKLKIMPKHLILALAGCVFALSATAQWQWVGKDGRKVFSDRPPPSEIQDKDILKQPGGQHRAAAVPVETGEPAPVAKANANTPRISGKDSELETKKKKLEDEEAAKKKAEDEKLAKSRAENCERVKKGLVTFQSGVRVATTNAKGEREIMDDAARAAESKRLQAIVDSDCK